MIRALAVIATFGLFVACGNDHQPRRDRNAEVSAEDAKSIFMTKCSICHGQDGKLGASGSPDLTQSNLPKDMIMAQLKYGKGNMPPQDFLSDKEMSAVADYVMSLRSTH